MCIHMHPCASALAPQFFPLVHDGVSMRRLQDDVGNTGWCPSFNVNNSGKRVEISLRGAEVREKLFGAEAGDGAGPASS